MDSMIVAQSPPASASSTSTQKSRFFLPLSSHGMPKTPIMSSPGNRNRAHRFSAVGMPSSPTSTSPPMSPMSPPMSPPMSAKSFGTFIDSEPSTPAYSPRMGSTWDSSTLVLLPPVASSTPSSPALFSPAEPKWEMIAPLKKTKRASVKEVISPTVVKEINAGTALSSNPITPLPLQKQSQAPKESQTQKDSQKENAPLKSEETTEDKETEARPTEEQPQPAALSSKLAKVKSLLRRKVVSDKKVEKKRKGYQDLDRMEDVHWSEM